MRFFMGVGRYTPNAAVSGDTGWRDAESKQWTSVINHWFRLRTMGDDRINARVCKWATRLGYSRACSNWCSRVRKRFRSSNIEDSVNVDASNLDKAFIQTAVRDALHLSCLST
jgi:hypothetical protein